MTTERLKEYGFLSEAVGFICPYQDFYGGRPIKRKTKEAEDLEVQEEEEEESEDSEDQGAPDRGNIFSCTAMVFSFILVIVIFLVL